MKHDILVERKLVAIMLFDFPESVEPLDSWIRSAYWEHVRRIFKDNATISSWDMDNVERTLSRYHIDIYTKEVDSYLPNGGQDAHR